MPVILPVKDKYPQFGNDCFIAPNATIVGDVTMGDDCSIWFNTVIRGDVNFIKLGDKSECAGWRLYSLHLSKIRDNHW